MAWRQWQQAELDVAEFKILRFSLGVMEMDGFRNQHIRGSTQVVIFGDKLEMFGHV